MAQLKGDEFMASANKKLKQSDGWICSAFGQKQTVQDDAVDLYNKAAAQYKLSRMYQQAGDAYSKCAQILQSDESTHLEARIAWKDAAKCYQHVSRNQAIIAYQNAIQLDVESDRLREAARLQQQIGDLLMENKDADDIEYNEHDNQPINEAIGAYEKAVEYYEMEHDHAQKNKVLLVIAQIAGSQGNWRRAVDIFEQIGREWSSHNLMRWKVKEILFKAAWLRMCSIAEGAHHGDDDKWNELMAIQDGYGDVSEMYAGSSEQKLVSEMIGCLARNDAASLLQAVAAYDRVCPLDAWKMELVAHLKAQMKRVENEEIVKKIMQGQDNEDEHENASKEKDLRQQPDPFEQDLNPQDLADAPNLEEYDD
eukprot:CAMPEP_0197032972 /NCGR_PEP_ID=MMETSP1384-20130603/11503_1 /TAXON_ID=29189 /ORGANISM="Ammonia sp." /LENGTH=366 /DNA_ID=CAMNT_0042462709 /DNA_START=53 /DNA_END=1153 /DNA_ORIENTATION=+